MTYRALTYCATQLTDYPTQLTDYLHVRMRHACKEERRDIMEVISDIKVARATNRKTKRQLSDNVTTKARQDRDNAGQGPLAA